MSYVFAGGGSGLGLYSESFDTFDATLLSVWMLYVCKIMMWHYAVCLACLSVSRGIVKTHGGKTGLFSRGSGQGSHFFFSLPLYISEEDATEGGGGGDEAGERQAAEAKEGNLKVFSGLRVLVVGWLGSHAWHLSLHVFCICETRAL